jgi:hypothetical protein
VIADECVHRQIGGDISVTRSQNWLCSALFVKRVFLWTAVAARSDLGDSTRSLSVWIAFANSFCPWMLARDAAAFSGTLDFLRALS